MEGASQSVRNLALWAALGITAGLLAAYGTHPGQVGTGRAKRIENPAGFAAITFPGLSGEPLKGPNPSTREELINALAGLSEDQTGEKCLKIANQWREALWQADQAQALADLVAGLDEPAASQLTTACLIIAVLGPGPNRGALPFLRSAGANPERCSRCVRYLLSVRSLVADRLDVILARAVTGKASVTPFAEACVAFDTGRVPQTFAALLAAGKKFPRDQRLDGFQIAALMQATGDTLLRNLSEQPIRSALFQWMRSNPEKAINFFMSGTAPPDVAKMYAGTAFYSEAGMKKLLESAGDDTALPRGAADSAARWLAQSAGLAPAEAVGILQKLPATCQKEAIRAWFQTTGASEPAAAWEALSKLPPEILDADTTEAVAKSVLFSEPEQWEKILSVLPEQTRQQAAPQIAAALMASGDSASAVAYAEKLFADPGGVSAKQAQPVLSALADGAASQPEDAAAFADFVETIQDPELRRIAQKEFVTQTYEHSSQALYEALVEQGTHGIEQSFLDTMLSDLPAGWKPPENIRLPWLSVPAATVHERPVFP